jgi:hypothetical protein
MPPTWDSTLEQGSGAFRGHDGSEGVQCAAVLHPGQRAIVHLETNLDQVQGVQQHGHRCTRGQARHQVRPTVGHDGEKEPSLSSTGERANVQPAANMVGDEHPSLPL